MTAKPLDATTAWDDLQPGDVMHLAYHFGPDSTWTILEVTPEGWQVRVLVSIDGGEPTEVKPMPRADKAIAASMIAETITITRPPVTVVDVHLAAADHLITAMELGDPVQAAREAKRADDAATALETLRQHLQR